MNVRFLRLFLTVGLMLSLGASSSFAWLQKKPKPGNQEKKDNARVRDAQQDLKSAREKLNDAERDLASAIREAGAAEAKAKAAMRAVETVRTRVEERLGAAVGLPRALSDLKAAQSELDALQSPLLTKLRLTAEYQAALKAAEDAKSQLRASLQTANAADADRKARVSEWNRLALAPGKLESAVLDANPAAGSARETVARHLATVARLRESLRAKVESDSETREASAKAESAKRDSDKAEASAAKERQRLSAAREHASEAQAKLLKAQAQDRKNNKKNKS